MVLNCLKLICFIVVASNDPCNSYLSPYDEQENILKVIRRNGYPVELHDNILTDDGYLLDMQRIPYGRKEINVTNAKKTPVLLVHGLLRSANDWIITKDGLGYFLADANYDVWLANTRGTIYSRKHKCLNPNKDRSYWEFSFVFGFIQYRFHEKGVYDLPALINYIKNYTGHERLNYIGHSEGTTVYFILMSERPEYNKDVNLMIALSPVAFLKHTIHVVFFFLTQTAPAAKKICQTFGLYGITVPKYFTSTIANNFCVISEFKNICVVFMYLLDGSENNENLLIEPADFFKYSLQGASFNEFIHYGQLAKTGHFRRFDYGFKNNKIKYGGKSIPPEYNLNNVSSRVALFYAFSDWFTQREDVVMLIEKLPNIVSLNSIKDRTFHHSDFIYGSKAHDFIYTKILKLMRKY